MLADPATVVLLLEIKTIPYDLPLDLPNILTPEEFGDNNWFMNFI